MKLKNNILDTLGLFLIDVILIWYKMKYLGYKYLLWVATKRDDSLNIMRYAMHCFHINQIIVEGYNAKIRILERAEKRK